MDKKALHELIDRVNESEVDIIYFVLSRLVGADGDVELLPGELEAIKEYEEAKARGKAFRSHEEAWSAKPKKTIFTKKGLAHYTTKNFGSA